MSSSDEPDIDSFVDSGYDSRFSQSADIEARNCDGWTALHVAAAWGSQDIVKLLLKHGAKVESKTLDGYTALSLAVSYGHKTTASLLVAHSFDVDLERNQGWASLLLAAENDQFSFEKPFHARLKSDGDDIDLLLEKAEGEAVENHEDWTVITSPANGRESRKST
jgi:ankyrin repeat protein